MPFPKPHGLFALLLLSLCASGYSQEATPTPSATPEPKELPKTSVQIVNATSVPGISLFLDDKPFYPTFPQGLYTADAPTEMLSVTYRALDPASKLEATGKAKYEANTNQSLFITGDFKPSANPDQLPLVKEEPGTGKKASLKPSVQFRILSHVLAEGEEPLRYRFFNAMPAVPMSILTANGEQRIVPGEIFTLVKQARQATYKIKVEQKVYDVFINQEGIHRNCTITFVLKEGKPYFFRAFENTKKSMTEAPKTSQ